MSAHLQSSPHLKPETLRLDIWLWRARFYKSRAISARTIRLGRIRLLRGGQTIRVSKPHTFIHSGDTLVFIRGKELVNIEILGVGTRRGPAPEARRLYSPVQVVTNAQTATNTSLTA